MSRQISIEQFKILGHPQRLAVLQRLMAGPATLSQLGEHFKASPAHIRHHLKVLEEGGLVEHARDHPLRSHLEKYFQASSAAYLIHLAILPETPAGQVAITLGSNDLAVQALAREFSQLQSAVTLHLLPLNSLDGLFTLGQGLCQMATCHLLDPDTGEYNRSYVRHIFPGGGMALLRLFQREQGLLLQPGNPLGIHGLADLASQGVRIVNREPGSGVRLWLDQKLKALGLRPESIDGYRTVAASHIEVARLVASGRADVGIGLARLAGLYGLDFIPLFEEPYELALSYDQLTDARLAPFFDYLSSAQFRSSVRELGGYTPSPSSGQAVLVS